MALRLYSIRLRQMYREFWKVSAALPLLTAKLCNLHKFLLVAIFVAGWCALCFRFIRHAMCPLLFYAAAGNYFSCPFGQFRPKSKVTDASVEKPRRLCSPWLDSNNFRIPNQSAHTALEWVEKKRIRRKHKWVTFGRNSSIPEEYGTEFTRGPPQVCFVFPLPIGLLVVFWVPFLELQPYELNQEWNHQMHKREKKNKMRKLMKVPWIEAKEPVQNWKQGRKAKNWVKQERENKWYGQQKQQNLEYPK